MNRGITRAAVQQIKYVVTGKFRFQLKQKIIRSHRSYLLNTNLQNLHKISKQLLQL